MSSQSIEIIPGILEQTFEEILMKARLVQPYVQWVHIDLADGKLVPNTTFANPEEWRTRWKVPLKTELHMMVKDPLSIVDEWIDAGFNRIVMHVEGINNFNEQRTMNKEQIKKLKSKNVEFGLAVDSTTPVEELFPYLDDIDCVLVMTVKAGFSGQSFIPAMLEKVRAIQAQNRDLPIVVDGGIKNNTVYFAVAAGATRLVVTSAIFGNGSIEQNIKQLSETVKHV